MRILIVENEVYLAQSIATKLASIGHECEILTRINDVLGYEKPDALLLSTNMFGENIYEIIKKFEKSIIILLISYISNDTVSRPLKAGASDYIQKPFMVEELIRKIEHFSEFKGLKELKSSFENYLVHSLSGFNSKEFSFKNLKFPLFIHSNSSKIVDKFAYEYAKFTNQNFKVIDLETTNLEAVKSLNSFAYILNFSSFKQKELLLKLIADKNVIINTQNFKDPLPYETLTLKSDSNFNINSDILTVDEYFKFIILNHQDSFSDTDLAKKLGISRKSLWEKRKRYDIQKNNNNS